MQESFKGRHYPSAREGVESSKVHLSTPQTGSPSYELAFADTDFLWSNNMRGVRLLLEMTKADLILREEQVESTVVVFGSARILERQAAEDRLEIAESELKDQPNNPHRQRQVKIAKSMVAKSAYYEEARKLGRLISQSCHLFGKCDFVVTTGGGPGIMEAANRGAHDVDMKSIGLNIVLPHEQAPNPYITPKLCFQFHYFAIRKLHFLLRAKALICFPGGFGTLDELFEALTLIQTKKVKPMPVLLFGEEFWKRTIHFETLVDEGVISEEDLYLFQFVETAEQAWDWVCKYYNVQASGEDPSGSKA